MGRHQYDFSQYFGKEAQKAWTQWSKEFLGSVLLILIASNSGLDNGFNWAVSYVVLLILFGEGHHFNSFVTFYKTFTDQMAVVQGLFYLAAQFLGAYVAGHLAGALGVNSDSVGEQFGFDDWQAGVKAAISISLFLWTFNHAQKGNVDCMPKGIFVIASIAVVYMFNSSFVFSYNRCFTSLESIKASGACAAWAVVAVIVTHVKAKLMEIEDKWFWE